MKIVHAVYSMEMGGAETLVAQLARLQRAHGHQVAITAYSKVGALGERLQAEGIPVYVLGEAHPAITMFRYWRIFRKVGPDVVHMHNPAPTMQAAPGARLVGAGSIISTRHSLVAPPYDRNGELKFSFFARLWVDWVVGICDATCNNLRGAPGAAAGQIVRVYNGVDAIELGIPRTASDHFNLLFVGRLAEIKDLPTLLRAVSIAVADVPHLRLCIVGDGPVRSDLQAIAENLGIAGNVFFAGQQLDTAPYFASADAFIMSSTSEGLPMSLLQAMSVGLPAIATDVGGMGEVLRLANSGLLAPVGDAKSLAACIVRLAREAGLRQEMGERAKQAFEQNFTLDRMYETYMRLYSSGRGGRLLHA